MMSDWFLSFRDRELFFEKMLLTADQVQEAVTGSARAVTDAARKACRWIIRLITWSLIALGLSLLFAIILIAALSTGWSPPWLNLILLLLSGITALAGMVLLAPIVMIMQPAIDAFPSLKQSLKKYPGAIASAAFLILFTLFSYWKLQAVFSPRAAASLFFVMLIIGLGSAVGWVALPPAKLKVIITSQLFLCFFFVLAAAIFPKLLPATSRWMRHNEAWTAASLDDSVARLVKIDPENPPAMFNADGSPRYSFTRDNDGTLRIFSADVEFDPYTGQRTSPVNTSERRAEVIAQARVAREAELARERTAAEARQAEQIKRDAQLARERAAGEAREAEQRKNAAQAQPQNVESTKHGTLSLPSIAGVAPNSPAKRIAVYRFPHEIKIPKVSSPTKEWDIKMSPGVVYKIRCVKDGVDVRTIELGAILDGPTETMPDASEFYISCSNRDVTSVIWTERDKK